MKEQRFDIHQHITNQIIASMGSGPGEFRLPWHCSAGNIMRPSISIASKNVYRGVNILTLWAAADELGYTSGRDPGAQVRKVQTRGCGSWCLSGISFSTGRL